MPVSDKVVLISGAAKGMGATHARAFAARGAKVVLGDILDKETEDLAAEIGVERAVAVHLDVTNSADWTKAVAAASQKFGRLDVLVNNAGILRFSSIEGCSDEEWNLVLQINLTGCFKGIRAAIPAMKNNGGVIVNISSTAGIKGFAGVPAYISSKFGVRGLTKTAAIELAPFNIRVNSVHPGNIDTDMVAGLYQKLTHVPMNRLGQPREISELVLFLAGDESSFCTGAEFIADGGETCGMPHLF